jgi:hypothetical protein
MANRRRFRQQQQAASQHVQRSSGPVTTSMRTYGMEPGPAACLSRSNGNTRFSHTCDGAIRMGHRQNRTPAP